MAWWETVDWQDPINRSCSLSSGLVGWWMGTPLCFGGTRMVDLLNRNHGTLTNMDPTTDWVGSQFGMGLKFTKASSKYVRITMNPVTAFPFTLTTAVRPLSATGGHSYFALSNAVGGGDTSRAIVYGLSGAFALYCQDSSLGFVFPTSASSFAVGQWYVVSCVFNSGAFALYVDGALAATSASALTYSAGSEVHFGVDSDGGNYASADVAFGSIHNFGFTANDAVMLRDQFRRGFPDLLNHTDDPLRYAEQVAAGGFKAAWAIRQQQVIGGGLGL